MCYIAQFFDWRPPLPDLTRLLATIGFHLERPVSAPWSLSTARVASHEALRRAWAAWGSGPHSRPSLTRIIYESSILAPPRHRPSFPCHIRHSAQSQPPRSRGAGIQYLSFPRRRESRLVVSRFDGNGDSNEIQIISEPVRLGNSLDSRPAGMTNWQYDDESAIRSRTEAPVRSARE